RGIARSNPVAYATRCLLFAPDEAAAVIAVKYRNLVDHMSLRFASQLWINRQGQRLGGRTFRFRKVAIFVFQIEKAFLQMEWDRIVNLAFNFVAAEMRLQLIPPHRANDKPMIDVMITGALPTWLGRKNDGIP